MNLKSVIPFTKELDFSTKVSEITSISLEREYVTKESTVDGNLFVTGEYKSHEVSANVIPFSYKIPFTIEIPDNLEKESLTLEITDFAYDMKGDSQIEVKIELELSGNILEEQEEVEEVEEPVLEVNPDEIIEMMERKEEEEEILQNTDEIVEEIPKEEKKESVEEKEPEEKDAKEKEEREGESEMILENVTNEEKYTTYHIHILKEGETIETICTMYNSNLSMLADYNDLSNVVIGEKILIPENDES